MVPRVMRMVSSVLGLFFFVLMIRRPPRSTLDRSSAASDVYKRQVLAHHEHAQQLGLDQLSVRAGGEAAVRVRLGGVADSYTHLRAHETVLDIVCRLLLENKKENKP